MTIDPNILIGGFVSVIVAIFGSAGFWQFVANQASKKTANEISGIKKELAGMQQSEEEREVRNSRRRILRFNDELYNHVKHSREYFDDILEDVNAYEQYCRKNPDFQNGKAVLAIENIERVYRDCMKNGDFI
jgi:hypothetical protein